MEENEQAIFNEARRISDPAARRAFVESACGDDALRQRIEALLHVMVEEPGFLESPAAKLNSALPPTGQPGVLIGRYQLLELIGEGGMGEVWKAEQREPVKRLVALKLIKAGKDSRQVMARFEAERQALALMDHPSIAKILDGGVTDSNQPFFVMELVQGHSITRYCDEQRLAPRARLELFIPVCHAIQHAHQKGIIHRDIKPSNVLIAQVDGRPMPKVIDFGVAKAIDVDLMDVSLETNFGMVVGTPQYMSPEQADTKHKDVDTRTDIYSLGVLLYELLTGSPPFDKKTLADAGIIEMLRVIREVEPPTPSTKLSSADALPSIAANRNIEPRQLTSLMRGDLDWIVMRSLEKDRNRRYATANGLAREIERYLNDEPVEAGPPSAVYRWRKFVRKHRSVFAAAGAFALLLIVTSAFSAWQAYRAMQAEQTARQNEQQAIAERERADEEAAIAKAVSEFVQRSLLGQANIANQPTGSDRNRNISVRELVDRAAMEIEGQFRGQERTQAAIHLTIGDAYQGVGEYVKAEEHMRRALNWRMVQLGAKHSDTLATKQSLAFVLRARGLAKEAEAMQREVLDGRTEVFGPEHPLTFESMGRLANSYWDQARYDEAQKLANRAIDGLIATLGKDHEITLVLKNDVAMLLGRRGNSVEAEKMLRQVVEGLQSRLGPDHPRTLMAMYNLGTHCFEQSNYAEAERIDRQVFEGFRTKLGEDHPSTLNAMTSLGAVCAQIRKDEEAESLQRRALELARPRLGADHSTTLDILSNLAAFLRNRRRLDEAEPIFTELLAGQRARLPAHHPDLLLTLNNFASLNSDRGRYDVSVKLQQEAVDGARKTLGVKHAWTKNWINNLGFYHNKRGEPQLAEALFREVLDLTRSHSGAESLNFAGQAHRLAGHLLEQKRYAEAEPLARESHKIRAEKEPDAWTTYLTQSYLGWALLGQEKYEAAEPFLMQGYEGMKKREAAIPVTARGQLTKALERIVQLYEASGKPDEAEKWRKQLPPAKP